MGVLPKICIVSGECRNVFDGSNNKEGKPRLQQSKRSKAVESLGRNYRCLERSAVVQDILLTVAYVEIIYVRRNFTQISILITFIIRK